MAVAVPKEGRGSVLSHRKGNSSGQQEFAHPCPPAVIVQKSWGESSASWKQDQKETRKQINRKTYCPTPPTLGQMHGGTTSTHPQMGVWQHHLQPKVKVGAASSGEACFLSISLVGQPQSRPGPWNLKEGAQPPWASIFPVVKSRWPDPALRAVLGTGVR